jgi:glycosyltransferase involved in cell wall biosynthesis
MKVLYVVGAFGSLRQAKKDGYLPRMLDMLETYSANFGKIYVLTIDREKFELPTNLEHLPFRLPQKKLIYLLFAGLLNYRKVDCVEAGADATAAIPLWVYKITGTKIFLHHCWDLEDSLLESKRPAAAFLAKILQVIGFRMADLIGVTTNRLKEKVAMYAGEEKVFLLPNYVDTQRFRKIKTRKIRNLLVFVGRLHPDKNLHMLLEAMRDIPQFKLWIIGTGPLKEELTALGEKYGLKNVQFLGSVPHDELPKYLNKAEAFIMVSHREGHPLALIEAMACGLPCIGTDVPGINDVIIDQKTGLLCKKSPEAIKECILKMFSDRGKMRELGNNALKFAVENYSKNKLIEKRMKILKMMGTGRVNLAGMSHMDGKP